MQSACFRLAPLKDDQYNLLRILFFKCYLSFPLNSLHHTALPLFICTSFYTDLLHKTFLSMQHVRSHRCVAPEGSRFGWQPQAINRCDSGRQPGLYLQREIIEGVFIHGQGLIQKILSHLDQKYKEKEKYSQVLHWHIFVRQKWL